MPRPHDSTDGDNKVVMAFDVGLKRTGVAVGQTLTKSTTPLTTLTVKQGRHPFDEIDKLKQTWQTEIAVVGNPHSNDPHLNKAINRLVHHLKTLGITVIRVDETLTSSSANFELSQHNIKQEQKIELRDQIAACLILESYFNELSQSNP